MINFHTKLPKDIELSPDLKSRAKGYFSVQLFGIRYFVAITKEIKKTFGLSKQNGYWKYDNDLGKAIRDVIGSIYLQVRDTVGSEIKQTLSSQIEDKFAKLFEVAIDKTVDNEFKRLTSPLENLKIK